MLELVSKEDAKGREEGKLVEHHTKYREIHGEDETVIMSKGEHISLHRRLRREGECKIPVGELAVISGKAQLRTKKYLEKHPRISVRRTMSDVDKKVKERIFDLFENSKKETRRYGDEDCTTFL